MIHNLFKKLMARIMPSCKETATCIASGRLNAAGPWKRQLVLMHFRACGHCARYAQELENIAHLFRQQFTPQPESTPKYPQTERHILAHLTQHGFIK